MRALAHPDQAMTVGRAAVGATPVVLDGERDGVGLPVDGHGRPGGSRVLDRVRQRLLHDPVDGLIEAGWENRLRAHVLDAYGESRCLDLGNQLVEPREA